MVSHPSRRALAFCAAVSLGIACIAPSQAAFAVEKAPAIPLVRPAVPVSYTHLTLPTT